MQVRNEWTILSLEENIFLSVSEPIYELMERRGSPPPHELVYCHENQLGLLEDAIQKYSYIWSSTKSQHCESNS